MRARVCMAGDGLLAYQSGRASRGQNVSVQSYIAGNTVVDLEDHVVEYLMSNGVRRIVVGHKPVGDCPLIVK